jgi:hypothetical protein
VNIADFVTFFGHGTGNGPSTSYPSSTLWMYNGTGTALGFVNLITNTTYGTAFAGFGGFCKWVLIKACRVLNEPNPSNYSPILTGVHAILGYSSLSDGWWDQWSIPQWDSYLLGMYFNKLWIKDDQNLLYSWFIANRDIYYYGYSIPLGKPGIAPALVSVCAEARPVYGQVFNGAYELFDDCYHGPVSVSNPPAGWSSVGVIHYSTKYGTPAY